MIDRHYYLLTLTYILGLTTWAPRLIAQEGGERGTLRQYVVAVLSPNEGPLREVGNLHDESVRRVFGLGESNETLIDGHPVRFVFRGTGDPVQSLEGCAEEARRVVENDSAIAILGPVASGCTGRVLSLGLEVPVLSSLSTARNLHGQDDWFFRTIPHDDLRLEAFIDTARARAIPIDRSIAIYETSPYGEGLLHHLQSLIPGVDSAHAFRWQDVFEGGGHDVRLTETFRLAMEGHHALESIFVLASSDRIVDQMKTLDSLFGTVGDPASRPSLVLAGSPAEPATNLPAGTWVIGEAQVRTSRNLISALAVQGLSDDLYLSSLDAGMALRQAVTDMLRAPGSGPPDLAELRTELRQTLDEETFPSSERGRSFGFTEGEINPLPTIPIYRVVTEEVRRLESANPEVPLSWVGIEVSQKPAGHLEGPVVVRLVPHGAELVGEMVTVQVEGLGPEPVDVKTVELGPEGTAVSFAPMVVGHGWFPSSFWIGTDRTPVQERVRIDGLGWPLSYLLAIVAALLGAVLYGRSNQGKGGKDKRNRRSWRYLERCFAGLLIAFLIIHVGPLIQREPLLSQIPIPRFGASTWFNAVASGLLGGWLGLNPLIGFAASFIGVMAPLFHSDSA